MRKVLVNIGRNLVSCACKAAEVNFSDCRIEMATDRSGEGFVPVTSYSGALEWVGETI